MKTTVPHYYKNFTCIADKCKHTCCAGWEIDIDDYTYNIYKNHKGVLQSRFEKNISTNGDAPHFVLDKNERCPFLNERNLCDIYLELGEESLCQICTDHPRFRNYFSDRTETGLGLCCEAAAELILKSEEKFHLTDIENEGFSDDSTPEETEFFAVRSEIFEILTNRSISFSERCEKILTKLKIAGYSADFNALFSDLEYMEENVSEIIFKNGKTKISDIYKEQLCAYFIYRHLSEAPFDGLLKERTFFALISAEAIEKMCKTSEFTEIAECARIYSSEIEYSEENTEKILNRIKKMLDN